MIEEAHQLLIWEIKTLFTACRCNSVRGLESGSYLDYLGGWAP